MTGRWASSTRTYDLPPDWGSRRVRILRRDPTCILALPGCTRHSVEVDHIHSRHDHDDTNLQGVCTSCHKIKTQHEATAARQAAATQRQRTRPKQQHPGLKP